MKIIQSILLFACTAVFSQMATAHPGHHEHHSLYLAFIHHITSVYHSLMSLAVLGVAMIILGFVMSLTRNSTRYAGAVLSIVGVGLLTVQP